MKKRIILAALLSLVLILSAFVGCSLNLKKEAPYTVYYDGYSMWSESLRDLGDYVAPSEATITFNGKTYTGKHIKTEQGAGLVYLAYSDYEGEGFSFQLNVDDGSLLRFSLDCPENTAGTFDAVQGRSVADALADDYISLDKYQVIQDGTGEHKHDYHYVRYVEEIRTRSEVRIEMNCDGTVCYFHQFNTEDFDNVKSVSINEKRVKKAVEKKLEEAGLRFDSFEIKDSAPTMLLRTPTNQVAAFYRIVLYRLDDNGNKLSDGMTSVAVVIPFKKYNPFKP